jgi:hypothetical protein
MTFPEFSVEVHPRGCSVMSARRLPIRIVCGAVLLSIAWVGSACTARAACGDHITIGHRPGEQLSRSNPAAPNHADSLPLTPRDPRPLCSGPNCKRLPTVPPVAPATPSGDRLTEWPCHLPLALVTAARGTYLPSLASSTLSVRRSYAIYHPPRITLAWN